MEIEGEKEEKGTYFFAALWAMDRQPLFADHCGFREIIENQWRLETERHASIRAWEYNLNSVSLYVLIEVPGMGETAGAVEVARIINAYRELIEVQWQTYREVEEISIPLKLWDETYELRVIDRETELESLRDFIVQKMLGGSELSELHPEGPREEDPETP